jgi:hypothetical protein
VEPKHEALQLACIMYIANARVLVYAPAAYSDIAGIDMYNVKTSKSSQDHVESPVSMESGPMER